MNLGPLLDSCGVEVKPGDMFHPPGCPDDVYKVSSVSPILVFFDPVGRVVPPRVLKRWSFPRKNWQRVPPGWEPARR